MSNRQKTVRAQKRTGRDLQAAQSPERSRPVISSTVRNKNAQDYQLSLGRFCTGLQTARAEKFWSEAVRVVRAATGSARRVPKLKAVKTQ